jgi:4-amino-4-deoxy-L-arabinose transferase-like glycosyltransferase
MERFSSAVSTRQRRDDLIWLAVIIALALVLRAAWVLNADADPTDGRFDDSVFYHVVATSLSNGDGYTNPFSGLATAQWPPGYPLFLAGLYWLFGQSVNAAQVANAMLGAATVVLVYALALRLFDRTAARLAALLFAVFPSQILFASLVYSETLFAFLFVLGLFLITNISRLPPLVALGLVAGAAALTRETGLGLLIIAALYWYLATRDWRRVLQHAAIALAACAAIVLPWTLRNAIQLDAPILISSSAGSNFWHGHHDGADGGFDYARAPAFVAEHGPRTRPGGEVDISNAGFRLGAKFALTHPLAEVKLAARKVQIMYQGDDQALDLNDYVEQKPFMSSRVRNALQVIANGYYYSIVALAALGMVVLVKQRHHAALLAGLTIGVITLGTVAFFAQQRYHYPLIPMFCVLAGAGLTWLWQTLRLRPVPTG